MVAIRNRIQTALIITDKVPNYSSWYREAQSSVDTLPKGAIHINGKANDLNRRWLDG